MNFNNITLSKSVEPPVEALPVHLLKGLFYLTLDELNKKFLEDKEKCKFYDKKWSNECQKNGIFFDLSQVRWVNMGAAALLTLWIERAKKDNIQVYVALPYKNLTTKENDKIEEIKEREAKRAIKSLLDSNKEKRIKANLFLKVIQFDRAIKCEHITDKKEVFISEKFEYQSGILEEKQIYNAFYVKENSYLIEETSTDFSLFDYKYIVPLTWIDSHNVEQGIETLEIHFEKVLDNKERGIETFDVLALKNVLLSELLKNVKEHAGETTEHGLLVIGLMSIKSLGLYQNIISRESENKPKYTDNIEQDYINWLFRSKFENFIEIYFGDSGVGIFDSGLKEAYKNLDPKLKETYKKNHNKEEKLEILDWAFDKWSTKKENEPVRGTKGLYRIKRIIDKYEGIILIKTDNLVGGYQKGGYSFPSRWIDNKNIENNIEVPGTFIQAKLCSYKEIVKFDFKFEISKIPEKQWKSVFYELAEENTAAFVKWVQQQEEFKHNNTLLVLKLKKKENNRLEFQTIHDALLNLKELSFIRQSNKTIVVYLIDDIGKEALSNIADSINQTINKEHGGNINQEYDNPNNENVYSPILLIGKKDNIFLFGENEDVISTLNEIYELRLSDLDKLKYFSKLSNERKQKVRHYFETDLIVSIDSNNKIIFNFSNIQSVFIEQIKNNIDLQKQENQFKGLFCTPKLNVVEEWFDIDKILSRKKSNEIGLSQFFAFGLYLKFKEKYPDYDISPKTTYILIDHNKQDNLAKEFAKLIGIDNANIVNIMEDVDYNIPRRTQLFDKNDDVIIITTIISSSETIRRLVKFTKRDLAEPKVILSLIDKRDGEKINSITTWGTFTDILSIYRIDMQNKNNYTDYEKFNEKEYTNLLNQIEQCQTYISPNYEKEEKIKEEKIKEEKIKEEKIRQHFIKNKAVHYNHIGDINGRHFTFYLDKQKILRGYSFIWDEFVSKISDWIKNNNILKFALIIPQYLKEEYIWENCVKYIQSEIKKDVFIELYILDANNSKLKFENSVLLDFGALTGSTINKFIENLEFPQKILIVILFSQFQSNEYEFYKKVRKLEYLKTELMKEKQLSMFDSYEEEEEIKMIICEMNIKIEFLHDLPIDVYNSSTCPICEHERMLEYYKMNNKYMIDFCEDRKKRLKIKSRKETNEHSPYDFYYIEGDEKHTELSSKLIMKMFELKHLLKRAVLSTQKRIEVFKQLVVIVKKSKQQMLDTESDLYAFLFLVSHEVLWFQKEPLVFREIRKIITEIALNVAVKHLTELTEEFSKNSNYDKEQCEKIAVRYKYAAITVLRSADKSTFCKNISKIIESSIKNGKKLSNNLIHNTFYHIHSLQFNKYNRSNKYFEDLKEQFKIIEKKSFFSHDHKQLSAFWDLKSMNETILKLLDIKTKSMATIFKRLQQEFLNLFKIQGHPSFYESFTALDFRTLDPKAYPNYLKYRDKSSYYRQLLYKVDELSNNWSTVNEAIISIVNSLPSKIFQSDYFRSNPFFLDYLVNNKNPFSTIINSFSQCIAAFSEEVLQDRDSYDKYHAMYDLIYKNLIEYKIEKNEDSRDSTLKRFLSDFDTNLRRSIDAIFIESDFQNLTLNISDSIYVFYPKTILTRFLKQIRENIKEKKNENDKRLDNVSIVFYSEIEYENDIKYVILTITNTGTHHYKKNFNPNGALYQFKEDLDCFGGSLDYDIDNELFVLKIKFLSYGE